MTNAEFNEKIIGTPKTLREWIAELDLHLVTLSSDAVEPFNVYAAKVTDEQGKERNVYIEPLDFHERSITKETEGMYLDATFETGGYGMITLKETADSFAARREKVKALRKAIVNAKFELARLAGMSDAAESSIDEVCRRMPEIAKRLYIDGDVL